MKRFLRIEWFLAIAIVAAAVWLVVRLQRPEVEEVSLIRVWTPASQKLGTPAAYRTQLIFLPRGQGVITDEGRMVRFFEWKADGHKLVCIFPWGTDSGPFTKETEYTLTNSTRLTFKEPIFGDALAAVDSW